LAIKCRYCGKEIRGNAAAEEYDMVIGRYNFTCQRCQREIFAQIQDEDLRPMPGGGY